MSYQQIVSVSTPSYPSFASPSVEPLSKTNHYALLRQHLRASYPLDRQLVHYRNPYELFVVAILLPQATVHAVNELTPAFFAAYPNVTTLMNASRNDLEKAIRHIGFYRQKAKYLRLSAQILFKEHASEVPCTLMELTRLPGIARRSANLIMSELYGSVEGVMVDTRVKRVAQRLGIAKGKSAEAIENDLMRLLPQADWLEIPQLIVAHAEAICTIRNPRCESCPLNLLCPSSVQ